MSPCCFCAKPVSINGPYRVVHRLQGAARYAPYAHKACYQAAPKCSRCHEVLHGAEKGKCQGCESKYRST